jgi:soluble lytic murein transglycosylase-like protein
MTWIELKLVGIANAITRAGEAVRRYFGWTSSSEGGNGSKSAPEPGNESKNAPVSASGAIRSGEIADKVVAEAQRQQAPGGQVDPALALAVGQHESGLQQFDKNGNVIAAQGSSARGVFQLLKGTADYLKVDRLDTDQNIKGGIEFLNSLVKKYGDTKTALEAYYAGPGYIDAHLRYRQAIEPKYERYADSILAKAQQIQVDVGGIHINQPGASVAEIQRATRDGITAALRRQTQQTHAQLAYAG